MSCLIRVVTPTATYVSPQVIYDNSGPIDEYLFDWRSLLKGPGFIPMIHLVFSNLKTWLNGIHHGVSAKHLQAYLNEFTFRFNRRFYLFNAFRSLIGIAGGVEAPTYADLYSGAWTHPTCSGCLH